MTVVKTCKKHGDLEEKDVQRYYDKRRPNKPEYLRCLFCRRENPSQKNRTLNREKERQKHVKKVLTSMKRRKININPEYLDDRVIKGKQVQVTITKKILNIK